MISDDRRIAVMDPWTLVDISDEERVLFGFCFQHPTTGGLAWTRSTPVRYLNEKLGIAQTASGRHYILGERISSDRLPTEEAQVALSLLVGPGRVAEHLDLTSAKERCHARNWITACKIARHLQLELPKRDLVEVEAFMSAHLGAYLALRAQGQNR